MPYRQAHWWIVGLLAIAGLAFWRDYLAVLGTSPWAWHLHGVTATLWLMALAGQSWTATTRRFAAHRVIGQASLGLYAAFFAGGIAVIHTMAAATPDSAFYRLHGAGLGFADLAASLTIMWLYYRALAERRMVKRHARYMLATPLLLLSPALGRVGTHFVPGLYIAGPPDFPRFVYSFHLGNLIATATAFVLYRAAPRHGGPFLVVAIGAATAWLGWIAGQRQARTGLPARA